MIKDFENKAKRSKEIFRMKSVSVAMQMYFHETKNMHLPTHDKFKELLDLHEYENTKKFTYHYNPETEFNKINHSKSKIVTYDGITVYGDGHVEDNK